VSDAEIRDLVRKAHARKRTLENIATLAEIVNVFFPAGKAQK